jgi:hypothetical protein
VAPLVHRFTLLKPGKPKRNSGSVSPTGRGKAGCPEPSAATGWNSDAGTTPCSTSTVPTFTLAINA